MAHARVLQTTHRGLDHESPAIKLFHQAKQLGTWDPRDVDIATGQFASRLARIERGT